MIIFIGDLHHEELPSQCGTSCLMGLAIYKRDYWGSRAEIPLSDPIVCNFSKITTFEKDTILLKALKEFG